MKANIKSQYHYVSPSNRSVLTELPTVEGGTHAKLSYPDNWSLLHSTRRVTIGRALPVSTRASTSPPTREQRAPSRAIARLRFRQRVRAPRKRFHLSRSRDAAIAKDVPSHPLADGGADKRRQSAVLLPKSGVMQLHRRSSRLHLSRGRRDSRHVRPLRDQCSSYPRQPLRRRGHTALHGWRAFLGRS